MQSILARLDRRKRGASDNAHAPRPTIEFQTVFDQELGQIAKRRPSAHPANLAGLALSGGGIRSSTLAAGILQALAQRGFLGHIDYISSVSGGGYLAATISAFGSSNNGRKPLDLKEEIGCPDGHIIGHLRKNASYLQPDAWGSLTLVALILLGFAINLLLVMPVLIGLSIICGLIVRFGPDFSPDLTDRVVTVAIVFVFWAALYAVIISTVSRGRQAEQSDVPHSCRRAMLSATIVLLIVFSIIIFIIIQKPAVEAVYNQLGTEMLSGVGTFYSSILGSIGFLGFFAGFARSAVSKYSLLITRGLRYGLGLVVPLLIWSAVLLLEIPLHSADATDSFINEFRQFGGSLLDQIGFLREQLFWRIGVPVDSFAVGIWDVVWLYSIAGVVLAIIAAFVNVNSTSLHNYYRDRINAAFIDKWLDHSGSRQSNFPYRRLKLSDLPDGYPLHIINAAVNLRRSTSVLPGRSAAVFSFSKVACGSSVTGFCPTGVMEDADRQLDLATAIAISGAAIGPNQGRTNHAFQFLLALANARLGYWMINPATIQDSSRALGFYPFTLLHQNVSPYFLFRELFGLLDEKQRRIYLSDGAHVEPLGAYELIRRRCRHLIIVDAEHDPNRSFRALANLARLVKIDFGYKIDIDLNALGTIDAKGRSREHAALGRVWYTTQTSGRILYIKASLTGDEDIYIEEYRSRSPFFPHETTADQFFTEPQFEAYRALGYHIMAELAPGAELGCEEWFGRLEARLSTRHLDYHAYLDIQRQIFDVSRSLTTAEPDAATVRSILQQIWVIEDAVIRLGLDQNSARHGPFRPLADVFRGWITDPNFSTVWHRKSSEVHSYTRNFVDAMLANQPKELAVQAPSRC